MSEFKREERYIVIKRKGIYPEQESAIRELLEKLGVLTVECVVIESDWPESETVWQMIKDRVEGRPNEIESLRQRVKELEPALDQCRTLLKLANSDTQSAKEELAALQRGAVDSRVMPVFD